MSKQIADTGGALMSEIRWPSAYIVTIQRTDEGALESYYVIGNDEEQARKRAAKLASASARRIVDVRKD
jgi:hypothetical protein